MHETQINEQALNEIESVWANFEGRVRLVPGKEAVCHVNQRLQEKYGVSVTPTGIIDAMSAHEIPDEVRDLINALSRFARQ